MNSVKGRNWTVQRAKTSLVQTGRSKSVEVYGPKIFRLSHIIKTEGSLQDQNLAFQENGRCTQSQAHLAARVSKRRASLFNQSYSGQSQFWTVLFDISIPFPLLFLTVQFYSSISSHRPLQLNTCRLTTVFLDFEANHHPVWLNTVHFRPKLFFAYIYGLSGIDYPSLVMRHYF